MAISNKWARKRGRDRRGEQDWRYEYYLGDGGAAVKAAAGGHRTVQLLRSRDGSQSAREQIAQKGQGLLSPSPTDIRDREAPLGGGTPESPVELSDALWWLRNAPTRAMEPRSPFGRRQPTREHPEDLPKEG